MNLHMNHPIVELYLVKAEEISEKGQCNENDFAFILSYFNISYSFRKQLENHLYGMLVERHSCNSVTKIDIHFVSFNFSSPKLSF